MDLEKYELLSGNISKLTREIKEFNRRIQIINSSYGIRWNGHSEEYGRDSFDIGDSTYLKMSDTAVETFKVLAVKYFEERIFEAEKKLQELTKGKIS